MQFIYRQKVLFKHCDPARIVFFPRYFEMLNDVVEAFFATVPGEAFHEMHPERGVPTARIEAEFTAPSRHGETLEFALSFTHVGRSSAGTQFVCTCDGETRLIARSVLVHVGPDLRPEPWTKAARAALLAHQEEEIA